VAAATPQEPPWCVVGWFYFIELRNGWGVSQTYKPPSPLTSLITGPHTRKSWGGLHKTITKNPKPNKNKTVQKAQQSESNNLLQFQIQMYNVCISGHCQCFRKLNVPQKLTLSNIKHLEIHKTKKILHFIHAVKIP
jgi:hypothetical protein